MRWPLVLTLELGFYSSVVMRYALVIADRIRAYLRDKGGTINVVCSICLFGGKTDIIEHFLELVIFPEERETFPERNWTKTICLEEKLNDYCVSCRSVIFLETAWKMYRFREAR